MIAQIREFALSCKEIRHIVAASIWRPVNFDLQRVNLSTHVGGWDDFDLTAFLGKDWACGDHGQ